MIVITTMSGKAILTCRPNSHLFQDRTLMLDQPVKIGRSVARARPSPNNAIFDCKVLSRNHALFWFANGKFYLQDTKSSNGTFVNNQRLSKSGEESLPREVCSGDIVQFGVDVIENTRKVTHGCIVANLKLFLPDGKEAITSHSTSSLSLNTIPIEELYELHQYLQEAMQREHTLETKLIALQEILNTIKDAADQGWKSLIAEDRLLTRVEALENQLQTYTKNFGEDKLKEEFVKLQEDKNQYQCTAKEFLKKVLDEKLEVVQKCQEVKRTLVNVEAAYACLTEDMEKSHASIQDLTHKLSLQLSRNEDAEFKIQELERKHKETMERLETRNKELEKIVAMRHAAEETLEKQLTDLRTAENIANEKASAFELQLKTLNSVLGENEYSSLKMDEDNGKEDDYLRLKICLEKEKKSKEVLDLISAQLDLLQDEKMSRLQQISQLEDDYEAYCHKKSDYEEEHSEIQSKLDLLESRIREVGQDSSESDVTLTPKIGNGKSAVNGSADNIDLIETQMRDLRGVYSEVAKFMENCEMNIVALKADIDRAKNNLIKTTGHCIIAQEKLEKAHENYEECHLISQVLKERIKMHQFSNEDLPDDENSFNKKNQEQEENILRRQLVEAQHVAKQSRNEQAQLLDKISALTAEIDSRNGPDDNKIQEKLMETQQECHRFQNTISLLQSEILSLNEQCSHLREEKRLIEQNLEHCKEQHSTTDTGKQDDDLLLKVSRLEEELVMFGSKYMKCNEERSALCRELANLRLDYEAILHQPYFNLIFAFPCIVLIVAFIVMFYPSLSQIMGTAEHTDKDASG